MRPSSTLPCNSLIYLLYETLSSVRHFTLMNVLPFVTVKTISLFVLRALSFIPVCFERLNMLVDNDQLLHKNRTPTHNLKQSTPGTKHPIICNKESRKSI